MSLNDKLEAFFQQHPDTWIDGRTLAQIAGAYGWRSRCADLRARGHRIVNRQQRVSVDGSTFVVSEYRLVTSQEA